MTLLLGNSELGTEQLFDVIETVLIEKINDTLAQVYADREAADRARAARRQVEYEVMEWDEIPPQHFHVGNFPKLTLAEVPPEMYPYVVLAVEDIVPDSESGRQDHRTVLRQSLTVHSLAKADEDEGSEVAYRRALRMGAAVHRLLMQDMRTASLLSGVASPSRAQASVPWTYAEEGRVDKTNWYQAVGINYVLKVYTTPYQ